MEKHVLIELLGGDLDGRYLDSQSPDPVERQLVKDCLYLTLDGQPKAIFTGISVSMSEAILRGEFKLKDVHYGRGCHGYMVEDRLDEGGQTLIRLRYSVWSVDGVGSPA